MAVAFERGDKPALLTVAEAAAIAGVGRGTIRSWCARGELPSVAGRTRTERLIRRSDLERHIAGLADAGTAADGPGIQLPTDQPTPDGEHLPLRLIREQLAGGDALRRIAAEVSGPLDLPTLFDDVIADSMTLFAVSRVGLWLYDATRPFPLTLAAHHDVPEEVMDWVELLQADARTAGMQAIRSQTVVVLRDATADKTLALYPVYLRNGIASVCFVPIVFRGEPLGLLVLYHDVIRDWTTAQQDLARSFADQMAAAIGNTRLYDSVQSLAARLRAIHDFALRLNRIRDLDEIASVIVEGTERLIGHDTIRVYRVDHEAKVCEPIAFKGTFGGNPNPSFDELRTSIGSGLTGWAAQHNQTILTGDAGSDPRGRRVHEYGAVESMLVVPMSFEDRAHGVIVVSADGRDRFGPDDEATLTIFAGYAAQAIVNFEHLDQLNRQQAELEHQLASQRRLLEVNERLLSTLDPQGVLELIADSLKTIVPYDALTIYRCDWDAGVRRAVIARDRFADVILEYAGPIGVGITGWVIEHGEAALTNDAHLDPRVVQVPGTPFEPESMIVVPLRVGAEVIGTLNIGRVGGPEAHFTQNEFELTKLFAGQASIALENAEAHGAIKVRAEHDALTGLRNHGQFQREFAETIAGAEGPFALLMLDLDSFKAFNDACGHPAGDALLAGVAAALRSGIREGDSAYRYGGDEFAVILPGANRIEAYEAAERIRQAVLDIADRTGPRVSISVGVACHPEDGATKDELVAVADQSLYMAKPSSQADGAETGRHDPYLAALDQTAIALMNRRDPDGAARDDHDPGGRPPRHAARLHLPRRARRRKPRLPSRHGDLLGLPRVPDADHRWRQRPCRSRAARYRGRQLRHLVRAGQDASDVRVRGRRRRAPDLGSAGHRRHRARVRRQGAAVRRTGDRRADAVRPARLHRPRQRQSLRDRAARRALRPDHGPAQPRAAVRPDRPCPVLGARGRGRVNRPGPPRPRSVQDDQREPRPRVRRPAPRGRRGAAQRVPAARGHRRPLRWRRVRRSSSTVSADSRRPTRSRSGSSRSSGRRSPSAIASGSSTRAWASRSPARAGPIPPTSSARRRSRSSRRSVRPA